MSLEIIASNFIFPTTGGIFCILGPPQSGKSEVVRKPSLLISKEESLKKIEAQISKFLVIEHSLGKIVLDEINSRFYKTTFFKTLINSCKENRLQLFLIITNMMDLPSVVRVKVDFWFLFEINNSYLGFPPINQLENWKEPEHEKYTAIVARFSENTQPEIWWYNSRTGKKTRTIRIIKNIGNNNDTTDISKLLKPSKKRSKININDDKDYSEIKNDIAKLQEICNKNFEKIFQQLSILDTKLESIMYIDDETELD